MLHLQIYNLLTKNEIVIPAYESHGAWIKSVKIQDGTEPAVLFQYEKDRLLRLLLSHTEKDRQAPSHLGFKPIQDAHSKTNSLTHSPEGLLCVRFERCVLSCTHCPSSRTVLEVCIQRDVLHLETLS